MKRRYFLHKAVLISLILISLFNLNAKAQTQVEDAYALFIYNIAKYSSWPVESQDFVIGVMGNNAVANALGNLSKSKKINGKQMIVETYSATEKIKTPNILFVGDSKSRFLKLIFEKTAGQPIMIITEKNKTSLSDVCVSFNVDSGNRLKFLVNDGALTQRKLKMAQSLKKMALSN